MLGFWITLALICGTVGLYLHAENKASGDDKYVEYILMLVAFVLAMYFSDMAFFDERKKNTLSTPMKKYEYSIDRGYYRNY